MSHADPRQAVIIADRLGHMIEAIDLIRSFTEDLDQQAFERNPMAIAAVRACFITIGEAAGRIPEDFRETHPEVPWGDARHFRNFLVHVYEMIEPAQIWETMVQDLPTLREQLVSIRAGLEVQD